MHHPTIDSTRLKSVFTHYQSWRRACARRAVVGYLDKFLLLFGSPSIIVLFSFVAVHTCDNVTTSNQHWSAKDYKLVVKYFSLFHFLRSARKPLGGGEGLSSVGMPTDEMLTRGSNIGQSKQPTRTESLRD